MKKLTGIVFHDEFRTMDQASPRITLWQDGSIDKKSENHIRKHGSCIVTDHQPDEAQLRPSLLLIAEDGEQLPEVMTKQEVMAMLRRVDKASNFPFSAAIVKALRAEGFDVETDTL